MKKLMKGLVFASLLWNYPAKALSHLRPKSEHHSVPISQLGYVSWYGRKFIGRRMSNGERFDPSRLTAASRALPLGTRLKLFCGKTDKSVIVTVTDRGPIQRKWLLDISEAAAVALGIREMGTALVRIEPVL